MDTAHHLAGNMAKTFDQLLAETEIYLSPYLPVIENDNPASAISLSRIAKAIALIDSQILELGQGPVVQFLSDSQSYTLQIGRMGVYLIPSDAEALAGVSNRLLTLAYSERFIKAIQGMWPA